MIETTRSPRAVLAVLWFTGNTTAIRMMVFGAGETQTVLEGVTAKVGPKNTNKTCNVGIFEQLP